jgi:hypothetical protein
LSDLQEKGQAILTLIADIRKKRAEQEVYLHKLEWQATLMTQGIDPEEVHHFLYDPLADLRKDRKVLIYTHAVMKDGTKLTLNPHLPMRGEK